MFAEYRNLPRIVYVLCLGTIINRCGYFVVTFLSIYVDSSLGLGAEIATWAVGCFGLGAVLAAFVGGHLADTIGRKTVALIALIGSAAVAISLPVFQTTATLLPAVFLFAFLNDMYRPAVSAILTDSVDSSHRPAAFGMLYQSVNLGAAVAPIVGGLLASKSYSLLFRVDAVTSIGYALVIALAVPETLRRKRKDCPSPDSSENSGVQSHSDSSKGPSGFRIVLRDHLFLRICLATLLVSMTFMQAMSTLPIYMNQLGLGIKTYGRLIALNGAMIVLLQIFVTRIVVRFDRGRVLMISALIIGTGFGATAFASHAWQFALTIVVWTIGEMMQSPTLSAVTADLAPANVRARYFGTLTTCFSGANLLAASVSGVILERLGGKVLWGMTFLMALAGAAIHASAIHKLRERRALHAISQS